MCYAPEPAHPIVPCQCRTGEIVVQDDDANSGTLSLRDSIRAEGFGEFEIRPEDDVPRPKANVANTWKKPRSDMRSIDRRRSWGLDVQRPGGLAGRIPAAGPSERASERLPAKGRPERPRRRRFRCS